MTVIAMTRELGTRGQDVAARVASELGCTVVSDEMIEHHLADRLEIAPETVRRMLSGEASLWERWRIGVRRVSQFTAEQVLLAAREGDVVIRGWGAPQLLRGVAHVLGVRVCAPIAVRVATVQQRLGIEDEAAARREIERSDEAQDRAVDALDESDWRSPTDYAIVLNTGQLDIETAADMVIALARTRAGAETPESRRRLEDKLVEARLREALGPAAYGIGIKVEDGVVRLSGALIADSRIETFVERARAVEGVREVKTDLHVVPLNFGA